MPARARRLALPLEAPEARFGRTGLTATPRRLHSRRKRSNRPAMPTTRRPTERASRGVDIRSSKTLSLAALIGVLLVASACATPIGVSLTDPQDVHRLVTQSVLTGDEPSWATTQTLQRLGLTDRFDKDPEATLAQIRGDGTGLGPDRLFALAELSFLYAGQKNRQEYFLASAVYAYAFLFGTNGAV